MLEFSPDWDARHSYLVLLACAVVSARIQVYGRLELLKGKTVYAWSLLSTWWVFTIYLVIPLVLFWLLDRTGALQDTSVFAAILVGLAYPTILAGGTSVTPSTGVAGVFDWLNRAADNLATMTTAHVAVADRLFSRIVVAHTAATPAAYAEVQQLALSYAESPAEVTSELLAATTAPDKAQIVYDYATSSASGLKPLSNVVRRWKLEGVVSPYTLARRWRLAYSLIVAVVAFIGMVVVFGGAGERRFLVWRMVKPGVSAFDLHRTRVAIQRTLEADAPHVSEMRGRLAAALMRPGLDLQRADEILRLLLLHRGDAGNPQFAAVCDALTDGLRAGSVDVRARMHHALLMLAEECQGPEASSDERAARLEELRAWEPLAADSPIDLERQWRAWHAWWQAAPVPARSDGPTALRPCQSVRTEQAAD